MKEIIFDTNSVAHIEFSGQEMEKLIMSSTTTIELQGPRTKVCTTIGCYHPVCLAVKRTEKENLVKQIKHDIDENIMQIVLPR